MIVRFCLSVMFVVCYLSGFSQVIERLEYFFDNNTNKTTILELENKAELDKEFTFLTNKLPPGSHKIFIRFRDDKNRWSHYEGRVFYILDPKRLEKKDIVYGEYFLNRDLGYGYNIPIEVKLDKNNKQEVEVDLASSGLGPGFHTVFMRFKDSKDCWGLTEPRTFYILPDIPEATESKIVAMEYLIGEKKEEGAKPTTDPGVGNAIAVKIDEKITIEKVFEKAFTNVPEGDYLVHVRVCDSKGRWSHFESAEYKILYCDFPIEPAPPEGEQDVCAGSVEEYFTVKEDGINSYEWKIEPERAGRSDPKNEMTELSFDPSFFGTAKIFVRSSNDCGYGSWATPLDVKVKGIPRKIGDIFGPRELCANEGTVQYKTTIKPSVTKYDWSINIKAAGNIAGNGLEGNLSLKEGFSTTGDDEVYITVAGTNTCGDGQKSDPYFLSISGLAKYGAIVGKSEICQRSKKYDFTVPDVVDVTQYRWSIDSPVATISNISSEKVTLDLTGNSYAGPVGLWVTGKNRCGSAFNSSSLNVSIVRSPITPEEPKGNINQCLGSKDNQFIVAPVKWASSYVWTLSPPAPEGKMSYSMNGDSVFIDWGNYNHSNAELKVQGKNACGTGGGTSVSLNFMPSPEILEVNSDKKDNEVCDGEAGVSYFVDNSNDYSLKWTVENGEIKSSDSNAQILVNWLDKDLIVNGDKDHGGIGLFVQDKTTGCWRYDDRTYRISDNKSPRLGEIVRRGERLLMYVDGDEVDNYQWSYNGNILTEEKKKYTFVRDTMLTGIWRIRVTSDQNCIATSPEMQFISIPSAAPEKKKGSVFVYPNPVAANERKLKVKLNNVDGEITVVVKHLSGWKKIVQTFSGSSSKDEKSIDLGGIPSGVYILEFISDTNGRWSKTIILQ